MASRTAHHFSGFRPVIRARKGLMLGIRDPLAGPVFDEKFLENFAQAQEDPHSPLARKLMFRATMDDAVIYCVGVMANHYDRQLGLSDATIEPFDGMLDSALLPNGK
jgi:hypothetical protein